MNKLAADAFGTNATVFPVGAVIVKQKTIHGYTDKDGKRVHAGDSEVGGMVKRSFGYDSKHGDWECFYFEGTAKIERAYSLMRAVPRLSKRQRLCVRNME